MQRIEGNTISSVRFVRFIAQNNRDTFSEELKLDLNVQTIFSFTTESKQYSSEYANHVDK